MRFPALLITPNCDIVQGYYFSKPLSVKDFNDWVVQSKQIMTTRLIQEKM
ncbi:hypothetical protein CRENPOLYSF1_240001 [Crenothrix polyspora]|uniref:EAL domain-containing protein n=1 Tax=Crenothrix polyspora TaxID=360316 RepID=A0A1R4H717_9GAMM|nr:hypothetical protein CRENPOLYSF1_240001 [Crenothrix polyspora]